MAAHRHKPARHCRQFRVCAFDDDEEEDAATRHMYPNPDFVKETLEAFPEQGVANVEEARVRVVCSSIQSLCCRPAAV